MMKNKYLDQVLNEAEKSLKEGNYPVGALLVIDGSVIGTGRNIGETTKNYSQHAETRLILDNAAELLKAWKLGKKKILYSSLEPCLMCLGMAVMNKVDEIVYIQDDPLAGACKIDVKSLGTRYQKVFPKIKKVKYSDKSKEMILEFLNNQTKKGIRVKWNENFKKLLEKK